MPTLGYLSLLLVAFSTLVSSKFTLSSLTAPAVYNNCSGNTPLSLPTGAESTPFFKPQIHPLEVTKNGTGWEEWIFIAHNLLPDGTQLIYRCKWSLGDPASANVSDHTYVGWAYFPNGTFYNQIVHDVFKYEEHANGGFTYSIANNNLTWDPTHGLWSISARAGGWIIETTTQK